MGVAGATVEIGDWAKFRSTKGAVKLHLLLDHDGCLPCYAVIWVTAREKFPAGNQDKTQDLENIFEGLQKSLRAFAAKNSLSGASASDTDEES